ncbi:hypothetical protein LTR08_003098 [Meristemomyces frigidus]|nr:hypothetical protein LTR08_003098 [Meristemomyces frigidus]
MERGHDDLDALCFELTALALACEGPRKEACWDLVDKLFWALEGDRGAHNVVITRFSHTQETEESLKKLMHARHQFNASMEHLASLKPDMPEYKCAKADAIKAFSNELFSGVAERNAADKQARDAQIQLRNTDGFRGQSDFVSFFEDQTTLVAAPALGFQSTLRGLAGSLDFRNRRLPLPVQRKLFSSPPVCVHCYRENLLCDGGPTCGNCDTRRRCMYAQCKFGRDCDSMFCTRMHPDQPGASDYDLVPIACGRWTTR